MSNPLPATDFLVHHSPFGAYCSFVLGNFGKRAGFQREMMTGDLQDIFIGYVRPGEPLRLLPFLEISTENDAVEFWSESEIDRRIGWASDSWTADNLTFTLYSPFGSVPDLSTVGDGEMRRHICPAVYAELTLDNRDSSSPASLLFGIGDKAPLRPLSDAGNGLKGMARGNQYGFAVLPSQNSEVLELLDFNIAGLLTRSVLPDAPVLHRLGREGGLLLSVPAGERRTFTIALGFYHDGSFMTGIPASFLYTRLFSDLDAVLDFAVEHATNGIALARSRDEELDSSAVSDERKFIIAHATHSYFASTMLLHDLRGIGPRTSFAATPSLHKPLWVVNEGQYQILNALDVSADQAFFEIQFHPWTLRNTLDLYVHRYSYTDEVQDATSRERSRFPGGLSFTHDMGVANQFAPVGCSVYEQQGRNGTFSYTSQEQVCNWALTAALYGLPTLLSDGDVLYLAARRATLHACLKSLQHRDGPENLRNGLMSFDSVRCGSGQETTTYESLDPLLGRARGNMYIAIKTWAAYLALSRCFDTLGEDGAAVEAEEQAAKAAATIAVQWNEAEEFFPAILEEGSPGSATRLLAVIEGLVYPFLWQDEDAISPFGRYGQLISELRRHIKAALITGVCIDAFSGGLKISSTSDTTFLSKAFLMQFASENVLGLTLLPEFDEVHADWLCRGGGRHYGFTDQVRSTDGLDLGARSYPRGVTSILWLL